MRKTIMIALATAMPVMTPMTAQANVENAAYMCTWLDSLDLFASPCGLSEKAKVVVLRIEGPKSDARGICKNITGTLSNDGVKFDKGWQLLIQDPSKNNAQTAKCKL